MNDRIETTPHIKPEHLDQIAKALVDQGRLIEAGWIGLRKAAIPADAPAVQLEEMRNAFFAGAQHLFGSIVGILDPGKEPTDQDLARMDKIDAELRAFIDDFSKRHGLPQPPRRAKGGR